MLEIRHAQPTDTDIIFSLIQGLAKYEKLTYTVTGNANLLREHLFGNPAYAQAIVAVLNNNIVAFSVFFYNYSTFLTQPGIYIEDIYVVPDYRRLGIGKALLAKIAQIAQEKGCGRVEWSVLDWNQSAIDFYQKQGATLLPDWRICRVTGDAIITLGNIK